MKKNISLIMISICSYAQQVAPPDAKPPKLDTGKYWHKVANAQAAKAVADQTPQAKAAQAADAAVEAEIQEMQKVCGGDNLLALDDDAKSPTYQDVICKAKPTPAEKKN